MWHDDKSRPVVPLVEETLNVSVLKAVTGRVRVSTTTETFEKVVRQELRGMRADIERVPIDRTLDPGETPPVPRTEGEVTIIPVLEEILVIEKRLLLKEELRITQRTSIETTKCP